MTRERIEMTRLRVWLLVAIVVVAAAVYIVVDMLGRMSERRRSERTPTQTPRETDTSRRSEAFGKSDPDAAHDESSTDSAQSAPEIVNLDLNGRVSISGRVLAPDGTPLPGARVWWHYKSEWVGTDADGRFRLTRQWPGTHRVTAVHAKYVETWHGPFELKANQALRGVVIRLSEGGFISGAITDEQGRPIAGATVYYGTTKERQGEQQNSGCTEGGYVWTNAKGRYTSKALPAGTYAVHARHDVFLLSPDHFVEVRVGKTTNLDITLDAGCVVSGYVVGLDGKPVAGVEIGTSVAERDGVVRRRATSQEDGSFVLRGLIEGPCTVWVSWSAEHHSAEVTVTAPASGVEIRLQPLARVRGRVIDKVTRQPVEKFAVTFMGNMIWSDYLLEEYCDPNDKTFNVSHHPDGRFDVPCGITGNVGMFVDAPGYAHHVVEGVRVVNDEVTSDILVELVRGTTLTFRVTSADDKLPIRGATVRKATKGVYNPFSSWSTRKVLTLKTDANGECSLKHFPSARSEFEVSHPDFAAKRVTVDVDGDESRKTVHVVLDRGLVLRGRVVSKADGTPVEGASVHCTDPGRKHFRDYGDKGEPEQVTGQDGAFLFERIPAGRWIISVVHDDFAHADLELDLAEGADQDLLVELAGFGSIVGTVTSADGTPMPGAHVELPGCWLVVGGRHLYTPQQGGVCTTGADGRYVFSDVSPGEHTLAVWTGKDEKTDNSRRVETVVVAPGAETRADFVLGGVRVSGVVTFAHEPAPGVTVTCGPRESFSESRCYFQATCRTNDEGRYVLDGIPPGTYGLTVSHVPDKWRPYSEELLGERDVLVGGTDLEIDFDLGPARRSIQGVVLLPDGRPAVDAAIRLIPDRADDDRITSLIRAREDSWPFPATTHSDGTFELERVRPGPYCLVVEEPGFAVAVREIHVEDQADLTGLQVQLERESAVTASIHVEQGDAPDAVRFACFDEAGRLALDTRSRVSLEDTTAPIHDLGPGRYMLVAYVDGHAVCRQDVVIASGEETRVQLRFAKGHDLAVAVVGDAGTPLGKADVLLDWDQDSPLARSHVLPAGPGPTDQEGHRPFAHLADGEYTVRVRCKGYEDAAVPVTIAGSDEEVTVTLRPRGG